MSLARIHEELMLCYREDLERHEKDLLEMARLEAGVEEGREGWREMEGMVGGLREGWESVWREVTRVEGKQAVIDGELRELEIMVGVGRGVGGGGTGAWQQQQLQFRQQQQGGGGGGGGVDVLVEERAALYEAAVRVDERLRRVMGATSELSDRLGGMLERRLSDDGPLSQVVRIVNAHQHALEWLARTADGLAGEGEEVEWRVRTTAKLSRLMPEGEGGNGEGGGGGGSTFGGKEGGVRFLPLPISIAEQGQEERPQQQQNQQQQEQQQQQQQQQILGGGGGFFGGR